MPIKGQSETILKKKKHFVLTIIPSLHSLQKKKHNYTNLTMNPLHCETVNYKV